MKLSILLVVLIGLIPVARFVQARAMNSPTGKSVRQLISLSSPSRKKIPLRT
jgi:hypothetical protein